jgi:hypothetical protein
VLTLIEENLKKTNGWMHQEKYNAYRYAHALSKQALNQYQQWSHTAVPK